METEVTDSYHEPLTKEASSSIKVKLHNVASYQPSPLKQAQPWHPAPLMTSG
jgi:hypothetical protein